MRHDEVDLQLRHLVGVDVDVAQRPEAGGDTIDGGVGFRYLLLEVLPATQDACAGVVAQFQFVAFGDDLVDEVLAQMFGTYLVYHLLKVFVWDKGWMR